MGFRRGGNLSKTQEELRKNRMDSKLKFWLAQIDLSEQEKDITKQTCIRYIDIVMKKTEAQPEPYNRIIAGSLFYLKEIGQIKS